MFVQVIKGKLGDEKRLKTAVDRWHRDLAPSADGWLGSTAGVTGDGTAIAIVRFESEQAAQRNSERPEQGEWWAEAVQAFSEDPTFLNSSEVDVYQPGDPGQAGFVQIMEGRGTNTARARQLMAEGADARASHRPDVLGALAAYHGDGEFLMAIYFVTEAAARAGEKKEMPEELMAQMGELNALLTDAPTFYDLRDPWLSAP
jgi:hypothetical protein